MFPFGNTNFNGSNFSGFGYGFNSNQTMPAHVDFDNNNFAGDWSGGVSTQPSNPAAELDPFGLGPIAFPEAYPQAGPSRSQDLISGPSYWEAAAPYEGSTVLDTAANALSYSYETMYPSTNSIPGTENVYGLNSYTELNSTVTVPVREPAPWVGISEQPIPTQFSRSNSEFATSTTTTLTPPPIAGPSYGFNPFPAPPYVAADTNQYAAYSTPTHTHTHTHTVSRGKTRATVHYSPYPTMPRNTGSWNARPGPSRLGYNNDTPNPTPGMDLPGFPFPSLSLIEPSSGPQRFQRSARKGEGGAKDNGKGKGRERSPSPPDATPAVELDTDWDQTLERFQATLRKVHNERTSGRLTPESAFAKLHNFIKEDIHQSPLPEEKTARIGVRPHRDQEQYLTRLLEKIHTEDGAGGNRWEMNSLGMVTSIANKLEAVLPNINGTSVRQAGRANQSKRKGVKETEGAELHRKREQKRRASINSELDRIGLLFPAGRQGKLSKVKILLYTTMCLVLGTDDFQSGYIH